MRILFILPDVDSFHKLHIHFGIAYISGILKANGYNDIKFLSVSSVNDYNAVVDEAMSFKPDIVGFTSVETQFGNVITLSTLIKEKHECLIVCGGAFPTLYPECIEDAKYLDGIFRGESETAFLRFVRAVENGEDYRNIDNFCFYDEKENRVIKNNLMPIENDLDHLGFPDRGIFNFQKIINTYGAAPFMFNRGCPYNCSFCSNQALASVYGRRSNTTRRRSVESCIAEIKDVDRKYKFNIIHIWDDLFISDRKWLYEFLGRYKSETRKPFMCTTRSNLCDDELFKKLKEGGCYRVHMSLESGNDFIRNKIMRRNISKETIIKSFNLANKYRIQISASSIIGIPFETEDMIKETISLLGSLKIDSPGVNIFYPYIGTRLREICEEYGMINSEIKYDVRERRESVLNLPHISKERLQYYYDNFEDLVRAKEGFSPYIKCKMKKAYKRFLPNKLQHIVRNLRQQKINTNAFPVYSED